MPRLCWLHALFFQGADSDGVRGMRVRGVPRGAGAWNKFQCLNSGLILPTFQFCPIPRLDLAPRKDSKGQRGGQRRRQRGDRGAGGGFSLPGGLSAALLGHPGCPLLRQQGWTREKPHPGTPLDFSRVLDQVSSLLFCCYFLIFLAALHGMWSLSSPVKD